MVENCRHQHCQLTRARNAYVMEVYLVGFEGNESVKDQN